MKTVLNERPRTIPLRRACESLGLNRSTVYARRRQNGRHVAPQRSRKHIIQARALSPQQRQQVRATLNNARFRNQAPAQVYEALLEDGQYLCSVSTMHRILREHGESGERRDQRPAQRNRLNGDVLNSFLRCVGHGQIRP